MMTRFACCAFALSALARAASAQYGNGADGALDVSGFVAFDPDSGTLSSEVDVPGATSIFVNPSGTDTSEAGDEILVLVTKSASTSEVGTWETAVVDDATLLGTPPAAVYDITLAEPLDGTYPSNTWVQRIPNFTDVDIDAGGNLFGSIIFFRASGTADIRGTITATGRGYPGGSYGSPVGSTGASPDGNGVPESTEANGGGGGAGEDATVPPGGGGGAYAVAGIAGESTIGGPLPTVPGEGGIPYGSADLAAGLFAGSGGGNGGVGSIGTRAGGGAGGGIVVLAARTLSIDGHIECDGMIGTPGSGAAIDTAGGGGGGAGGTVWLRACGLSGSGSVSVAGGIGGAGGDGEVATGFGGDGGGGRLRIDAPAASLLLAADSVHYGTAAGCTGALEGLAIF